jgi:hypothetical protein
LIFYPATIDWLITVIKVVLIADNTEEKKKEKTERTPLPRKRRWGSSKSNRSDKKPVLINTDCLKVTL